MILWSVRLFSHGGERSKGIWSEFHHLDNGFSHALLLQMAYGRVKTLITSTRRFKDDARRGFRANVVQYSSCGSYQEELPPGWFGKTFPKLTKLSRALQDIDSVDGVLINIKDDDAIIVDDRVRQKMLTFKALARIFIGCPAIQQKLKERCFKFEFFSKPCEREPMVLNSLTVISNVLNITAQQRQVVRFTISPQVTQHRMWTGALEQILNGLKEEVEYLDLRCPSKETKLGLQVILSCLKFLSDTAVSCESDISASWMRPAPVKGENCDSSLRWEDFLEMFTDLLNYLEKDKDSLYHLSKIVVMREGLAQIKDVFVNNTAGYREIRQQEYLVQKKLTKTLGHSSRCLFTLLLYYLFGRVRDVKVDLCGGLYTSNVSDTGKAMCLSMGRILTSKDEKMVQRGVRELDRALGLFKFVWETAGMKDDLELQGHLWCVGGEDRSITYRGKTFFVHDLSL